MENSGIRIRGIYRVIVFGALGLFAGYFIALQWNPLPLRSRTQIVPAPYILPKIPGGTALRLAMVHDVLHERYLRHGSAWYTQRNTEARKIVAQEAPARDSAPSPQYLDALDDLAVGLEQTGQTNEAIRILKQKLLLVSPLPPPPAARTPYNSQNMTDFEEIDRLDLQRILAAQDISPLQHHQYTTLANLGTMILLDALRVKPSDKVNPSVRSQMDQSLDYIERAIAINPGGHFGREVWQAILIEHLIAAFDHPDLLTEYDLIGESLDEPDDWESAWRPFYFRGMPDITDPNVPAEQRLQVRMNINRLGIDPDWAAKVNPDYLCSMPFDEPALAIVGMWTLGGGPNPHFALALGRMMESIGQNYIAWNAYERAVELQNLFWPDPLVRAQFVKICRKQQDEIAKMEDPANPTGWQDKLRIQHTSELAWGLAYQQAYQSYEAAQISAGVALNDPDFYTAFFRTHPSIASSPGLSDDAILTRTEARSLTDFLPCLVLGLGAGMALSTIIPEKTLS
jgi:hypothetical protein